MTSASRLSLIDLKILAYANPELSSATLDSITRLTMKRATRTVLQQRCGVHHAIAAGFFGEIELLVGQFQQGGARDALMFQVERGGADADCYVD